MRGHLFANLQTILVRPSVFVLLLLAISLPRDLFDRPGDVTMKAWASLLVMAVIVCWWLLQLLLTLAVRRDERRNTFQSTGRCRTCGYDLRGTPTRCPECGTSPPARAARSAAGTG